LRYTPCVDDAAVAWQTLLGYAEDLARHYAVLAAGLSDGQRLAAQQQAALVAGLHEQLDQQRQHIAYVAAEMDRQRHEREAARQKEQADAARTSALLEEARQKEQASAARADAILEEARRQLADMRQCWTWRIGRLVVGPVARAKRWRRRLQGLARLHPPAGRRPGCTPEEPAAFLAREDEACRNTCAAEPQPFTLPLPTAAPAALVRRRAA
jgi:hypothetical protein